MPAKTVSKICRKHLAESTGRNRGRREVGGRYTLGPCDWRSRSGYRKWVRDSRPGEGEHTAVCVWGGAVGGAADPSGIFHREFL